MFPLVYLIIELITQYCDYCLHFSLVGKAAFPEDLLILTHPQQLADVPSYIYNVYILYTYYIPAYMLYIHIIYIK